MRRALAFLKKELLEVLPPTLFFIVVFHVVIFVRRVIAPAGDFYLTTSATAIVGALIIGKSVLIIDATPLAHLFRDRRLVYNVVWRTCLYLLIALGFQLLEELVPLISKAGGLGPAVARLGEEIDWRPFWATHVALGVFLGFYTVMTALIDVIGRDRFLEIFFGSKGREAGAAAE